MAYFMEMEDPSALGEQQHGEITEVTTDDAVAEDNNSVALVPPAAKDMQTSGHGGNKAALDRAIESVAHVILPGCDDCNMNTFENATLGLRANEDPAVEVNVDESGRCTIVTYSEVSNQDQDDVTVVCPREENTQAATVEQEAGKALVDLDDTDDDDNEEEENTGDCKTTTGVLFSCSINRALRFSRRSKYSKGKDSSSNGSVPQENIKRWNNRSKDKENNNENNRTSWRGFLGKYKQQQQRQNWLTSTSTSSRPNCDDPDTVGATTATTKEGNAKDTNTASLLRCEEQTSTLAEI